VSEAVKQPTGSRNSLIGLVILIIIYILVTIALSEIIPFNKGPDEGINLDYIEFIAVNGRLPITYAERDEVGPKANWPPLYHLVVAGVANAFHVDLNGPPEIKIFWDSFRYRALDLEGEDIWYLPTEDNTRPYFGRFLVLHIGRWLSIIFSVITLLMVYVITLEILPGQFWLALAGVAILAFTPAFIFMGAVLNEDALVAALAALYLWMLVKIIKQPQRLRPYWILGLSMGVSVTVKYTTVVLPLEIVAVLTFLVWRRGYSWQWWLKRIGIVASSAIITASWWFGWNFWFLNEIDTLGFMPGLLRPLFSGGYDVTLSRLGYLFSGGEIGLADLPEDVQIGTFPQWVWHTFLSFWAVGIGTGFPLYPYGYIIVGGMLVVAGIGLWRLWKTDSAFHNRLLFFAFHITIFTLAPLVRFGLSRRIGQTAQGRHILIPAAAAIIILLVWGLAAAIPRRWHSWSFAAIIIVFMGWTGMHLYRLATYSVPPLPLRTTPLAAEWLPDSANAPFGDSLELVTYQVDPQPQNGTLELDLAWRSLAPVNENYLLDVTLQNSDGEVVSYWQGYNGQGRVPTLAWEPGDTVFDRLILPAADLPVGDYVIKVQLLNERNSRPIADPISFPLTIDRPTGEYEANSHTFGDVATAFWRVSGPVKETMPVYRYPATIAILSEAAHSVKLIDSRGDEWPPTRSEAGIYTFVIGPRWSSGEYRVQIESPQGDLAVSEPLLVIENWWERDFEVPDIVVPLEANFANQLKFLGYDLPQNRVKTGEAFPLTLYWQALPDRSPQANFVQFNHLLDGAGNLRGGYDRQPLEYYSTLLWAPGEVVTDGYAVPVDPDASPGEYFLDVGYYITVGESAVNLPLVVDGEMTDVTSVTVGPIEVLE